MKDMILSIGRSRTLTLISWWFQGKIMKLFCSGCMRKEWKYLGERYIHCTRCGRVSYNLKGEWY